MANTLAKQENGQFQILFTVPQAEIKAAYQTALAHMGENIEVAGFRKGKAPVDKVEQKLNKNDIYEHMVQDLLPKLWNEAIVEHKLRPIINPNVRILKSSEDSDWQFEATSCEMPTVEIDGAMKKVKGVLKVSEILTLDKKEEKKELSEDEKLAKIFEALVGNVSLDLPEILVKQEADRQLAELLDQIQKLGLNLEQYLSSTGKNAETLRADYAKRAAEQLKIEFILAEISKKENIKVTKEELDQLIDSTSDVKLKESLKAPEARRHIELSMIKRKTVEYLLELAR